MTSTICLLPILAALFVANNTVGIQDVRWNTINAQQEVLTQNYWPNGADLQLFQDGELQSKASSDVSVVNQFVNENKFDIQLTDLHRPDAFYVASILKVALEWKKEGEKTTLKVEDKEYPAVKFDLQKEEMRRFCWVDCSTILHIETKNGDYVYIKQADKKIAPLTGFALVDEITNKWQKMASRVTCIFLDEVIFPMVDINETVDIGWLENMRAYSGLTPKYIIAQALQQTKFQMNEKGAKVESAAAMTFIKCSCFSHEHKRVFKIDDSFYLWIMRPGVKTPIFAAYVDKDSWKAPAE
ncbi:MAG: hypothetical protein C0412_21885 [Flavobacterium sp.]|nr:hypothetical protein [Flavobacterium sp.]